MIHLSRSGPVLLLASVSACAIYFLCPQAVDATAGLLSELDGFGGEKALSLEAEFGSLEHDVPLPGGSREISVHDHHHHHHTASRYDPVSSEIRWPSEGGKKSFSGSKAERLSKRRRYYARKKSPVSDDGGGRRMSKRKRIQKYEMLHGSSGRIPSIAKHRSNASKERAAPRWRKYKKSRNRYSGDKIEEMAERSSVGRRRYESASTSGSAEVPDKDSKEHVKRIKLRKNRDKAIEKEERTKTRQKEYPTSTTSASSTVSYRTDGRTTSAMEPRSNNTTGNSNPMHTLSQHATALSKSLSTSSVTESMRAEKTDKAAGGEAASTKSSISSSTSTTSATPGQTLKLAKKSGFPIIHRGEDHLELIYQPPSASRRSPRIVIKGPVIAAPGLFKDIHGRSKTGTARAKFDTTERIVFEAEVGGKILAPAKKADTNKPLTTKKSLSPADSKSHVENKGSSGQAVNVTTTTSSQNDTKRPSKASTENPLQVRSEAGEMMSRETDKGFQQFLKHFLEKKLFKAMNYLKQELRDIKEIQRKQLDPSKHHSHKVSHEGATAAAERRGFLQTRSVAPHALSSNKDKAAPKSGNKTATANETASSNSSNNDSPTKILLVQGKGLSTTHTTPTTSHSTPKTHIENRPRSTRNFEGDENRTKAADNKSSTEVLTLDELPGPNIEVSTGSSELPNLSNLSRIINNIVGLLSRATGSSPKPEPA